ncbi:MAG TPA: hypothetical protein VM709_13380 [Candidatus Sulfotelmatobacter sp.]|nr:hypothetical protein [Candidatus Sulfotelmatobacter sp.]
MGTRGIHSGNGFPVISKKREPPLAGLGISGSPFHPAGDRSFRNIKTQHEKFTMDARRSHVGLSATIWKINPRTSFEVGLLPTGFLTLEIILQYQ